MSLQETVSAERVHIGFFGKRNAGKSSLVNAVTGQELAVVSDVLGTTTDPVKKAMEILPLGPVVIIDTPGLDDLGELGEKRVKKAKQILAQTDLAVLVVDGTAGLAPEDEEIIRLFEERKLPYLVAMNKADLGNAGKPEADDPHALAVSALTGAGVYELKERLGAMAKGLENTRQLLGDLLTPGDLVVLVVPIDESAPKGRLILPQQQTLREVLDNNCMAVVCQDTELSEALRALGRKPRLVITDSQAFGRVTKDVPEDVPLTSFSILFARYKGELAELLRGAEAIGTLRDGDRVLISEGCTHHRQCGDIGTVKMPAWIRAHSGAEPEFFFTSGGEFPEDPSEYALIVHCGGCMLNAQEMKSRMERARKAGVPMVNYGAAIAKMHGILERSVEPFLS